MKTAVLGNYCDVHHGKLSTLASCNVDIMKLIESRLLIQANSGSGKSWAIRKLLEQTHGEVQQIVLDIEGEFHSLREKFDYVICGQGVSADCSANVRSAGMLARKLLELNVSAIIDLYELKAHDRIRFVRLFLESFIDAPRALWHPCLVVIDEAHVFAPQAGHAESCNAVIDLMTRGRKRGFCGVLCTQRISKLHKDAAAENNNKLIGRSALDVDMKRAADELGFSGKDQQASLRQLEPGCFYAFGPAFPRHGVSMMQVGDVCTTHPKVGQRAMVTPPPREKVKAILSKLADLPQQAEREARSIEDLQRQNVELQRRITQGVKAPDPAEMKALIQAAEKRGHELAWSQKNSNVAEQLSATLEQHCDKVRACVKALATPSSDNVTLASRLTSYEIKSISPEERARRNKEGRELGKQLKALTVDQQTLDGLSPRHRRLLAAIHKCHVMGYETPTREQVAFWAGLRPNNGNFANLLGMLRTAGVIDYPSPGTLRAIAPCPDEVTDIVLADALDQLQPRHRRIIEALKTDGVAMTRAELGEKIGLQSNNGNFANLLGSLKTAGVIEYPSQGSVVLAKWLAESWPI